MNDVVVMLAGHVIVSGAGIDVVVVLVTGMLDEVVVVVGVGEFGEVHAHVTARQTKTTCVAGRGPRIRQDISFQSNEWRIRSSRA